MCELQAVCFSCRETIVDGGIIHVPHADVKAAMIADQHTARAIESTELNEFLEEPEDATWQVHCHTCNPHRADDGSFCADCYSFDTNRCTSWSQLIEWTAHLYEKEWLKYTDWMDFIRRAAVGSSNVGLIAPRTDDGGTRRVF